MKTVKIKLYVYFIYPDYAMFYRFVFNQVQFLININVRLTFRQF